MKKRYNNMYAPTQDPEKELSSDYEDNSYILNDSKNQPDRDGINVTAKKKPVDSSVPLKYFVSTTDVNFRLTPEPNRTDNIIGVLKKDLKVKLLDDKDPTFLHVEFENKKGYVMREYLKEV